jgi:general secretion pathway protein G
MKLGSPTTAARQGAAIGLFFRRIRGRSMDGSRSGEWRQFVSGSTQRRNQIGGFTVVELLLVVAVILTLSAIAIPNLSAAVDRAKVARAIGDIRTVGGQVQVFDFITGQYPDTLDEVGFGSNRDPWGHSYQYLNFQKATGKGQMRKDRFLVPINSFFDLYSMGKDGASVSPLTAQQSQDDIIWANDGGYVGLGKDF